MRALVTGSTGHLGEALVRTLLERRLEVAGLDRLDSPFTRHVGSLADPDFVRRSMRGVDVVFHAATLHKPHAATHSRSAFVETNVQGTLNVLEAALAERVSAVVFTSTTSAFGTVLRTADGEPAIWVTEAVESIPKNIYGVTKRAAEDLCELFQRTRGLPTVVLRTSRFFLEEDDDATLRERYDDQNHKTNEYLHRRLDLADAVDVHVLAAERAAELGFGRYVVSGTTPFTRDHLSLLGRDAPAAVRSVAPEYEGEYERRGWTLPRRLDRVYVNQRAREELGWQPRFDFRSVLDRLRRGEPIFSPLALAVGSKGYHPEKFTVGPYPVDQSA